MDEGHFSVLFTLPDPLVVGDCEMQLTFTDADSLGVRGAALQVTPTMTDTGAGTTMGTTVVEIGEGDYEANWTWSGAGSWQILLEIAAQGKNDALTVAVEVQ
jgi:hypothetical protein